MRQEPERGTAVRECPHCLSEVPVGATRCRFCAGTLPPLPDSRTALENRRASRNRMIAGGTLSLVFLTMVVVLSQLPNQTDTPATAASRYAPPTASPSVLAATTFPAQTGGTGRSETLGAAMAHMACAGHQTAQSLASYADAQPIQSGGTTVTFSLPQGGYPPPYVVFSFTVAPSGAVAPANANAQGALDLAEGGTPLMVTWSNGQQAVFGQC